MDNNSIDYRDFFNEKLTDEEILRSFAVVMPYINKLTMNEGALTLADTSKCIHYIKPDDLDFHFEYGSKPVSTLKEALDTNKSVVEVIPEEVFGAPLKLVAVPIRNAEGKLIGAITNGVNTAVNSNLTKNIENLADSVNNITSSVNQMSASSVSLAQYGQNVIKLTEETKETVEKTRQVIEIIEDIAKQTNLLGLNAAIESSRAGEHGKGFSVVASEVRKLASKSKESATVIRDVIDQINKSIETISQAIQETAAISQEQAATTQEVTASVETINGSIQELNKQVKNVF